MFLKNKYKLDLDKININKLMVFICLINAFIISLTSVVCFFLTNIPLVIGVSIILLFSQIYMFYTFIFKILIQKGIFQKN